MAGAVVGSCCTWCILDQCRGGWESDEEQEPSQPSMTPWDISALAEEGEWFLNESSASHTDPPGRCSVQCIHGAVVWSLMDASPYPAATHFIQQACRKASQCRANSTSTCVGTVDGQIIVLGVLATALYLGFVTGIYCAKEWPWICGFTWMAVTGYGCSPCSAGAEFLSQTQPWFFTVRQHQIPKAGHGKDLNFQPIHGWLIFVPG